MDEPLVLRKSIVSTRSEVFRLISTPANPKTESDGLEFRNGPIEPFEGQSYIQTLNLTWVCPWFGLWKDAFRGKIGHFKLQNPPHLNNHFCMVDCPNLSNCSPKIKVDASLQVQGLLYGEPELISGLFGTPVVAERPFRSIRLFRLWSVPMQLQCTQTDPNPSLHFALEDIDLFLPV